MWSKGLPAEGAPGGGRFSRLHLVALLVILAAAIACGLYWWRLLDSQERQRAEALSQIGVRGAQLADAVAGQTEILVRLVDFAVQHLRDDYAQGSRPAFDATVKTVLEAFPAGAVPQVGVIDAEGYLAYSNLGGGNRVYLGDRAHFKAHLNGGDHLFISKPVFGRVSRSWSIQFSRAIFREGRFLGVMVLSVAPEYIARSLALKDLGEEDVIALLLADGTFLSRSRGLLDALGRAVPPDRPFLDPQAPAGGTFRRSGLVDAVPRIYAWRRIEDQPLVVIVGIEERPALRAVTGAMAEERRRNATGIGLVMLLAGGVAVLLLAIATRQRVLAESESHYRSLFQSNNAVKLLVDPLDGRIVDANVAAEAFYGYDRQRLLTMHMGDLCSLVPEQLAAEVRRADQEGRGYLAVPHRLASGEVRHVEAYRGRIVLRGRPLVFAIIHDVTRRRELEASQRLAQSVFESAGEAIIVTDRENRILAVNPAFTRITGYGADEVLGRNPSLLSSGTHDQGFYRTLWQRLQLDGHWEGEISNRRKDGQIYVEWLKISLVRDEQGEIQRYVGLFSDVTERKRQEDVVWRQANFDPLTGLANRRLLDDRLERLLAQAARRQVQVAVLFIDLDHFKPVNDRYGHAAGDDLLQQVARRIEHTLRDEDTVARLGGDEFVAVLPDLLAPEAASRTAEKLITALSSPFRVGDYFLEISCSVGIALFPRDGTTGSQLIEKADGALYRAKQAGRSTWSLA